MLSCFYTSFPNNKLVALHGLVSLTAKPYSKPSMKLKAEKNYFKQLKLWALTTTLNRSFSDEVRVSILYEGRYLR